MERRNAGLKLNENGLPIDCGLKYSGRRCRGTLVARTKVAQYSHTA